MEEFDRVPDRRNTHSTKWDRYAGRDVLPFWVADMDFRTPQFIVDRLRRRLDHGVLGYTRIPDALPAAVCAWLETQFGWRVHSDWLVWLPGIVPGLNLACRAVTDPGDRVLLHTPVYYPFRDVARNGGRQSVEIPLVSGPDRWGMDIAATERAAADGARLLLLCNPQNPTGRIFDRAELEALGDACVRHDVVVCSDEIHCSLRLDADKPHLPIAMLSEAIAQRSITLMAPNKTYNTPGIGCAFAVIPNARLRERFRAERGGLVPSPSSLAIEAALAAYDDTSDWVPRLVDYLTANRDLLQARIAALPAVASSHVEATYLAWIDVRRLLLDQPADYFETHGIGLSDGASFGGAGFVRFNFGCAHATLDAGLERFERAVVARASSLGERR
jgi:cysteine-S-conjugate beta-lyase